MRDMADKRFPFAGLPSSWFVVAASGELEMGQVVPLRYFGRELVLYRGSDGKAVMLDAYCPHLGAHLGHGGKVCGETLQCPFHGWRFDGEGVCVEVPNASKIPPKALTRSWPVVEQSGWVFAWHDREGKPPGWQPPSLPEFSSDDWLAPERKRWTVRTHVLDTNENNCDRAHLLFVHGLMDVRSTAQADDHVLRVRHEFKADMTRLSMPGTVFDGTVEGTHSGLGVLTQRIRAMVEGLLLSTQTPIDDDTVDLRFTFTVQKSPHEQIAPVASQHTWPDLVRDVRGDIRSWERKVWPERRLLSEPDGPTGL